MFERLGRFAARHRWIVIAIWALLVLVALPTLPGLETHLKVGGFTSDHTEGAKAVDELEQSLGLSPSTLVVVYQSDTLAIGSDEFNREVSASLAKMRAVPGVTGVVLPSMDPTLVAPTKK
ncbi:MAG TPA: hypothetical protein VFQ54_12250, partial [Thermomicrobiales bacterium]|nr:hypothetical protein [Thermomicrobiales bacterium]